MQVDNGGTTARQPVVTVIIPYYQREAGILSRALASVFLQRYEPAPTVLVIDDASPLAAQDEVAGLPAEQAARVVVIRQENAGPGAARNRGLDSLGADTDYVAFLDSDDTWLPGHLARAVTALEAGHDFYFSNYRDIGSAEGGFEARQHFDVRAHEPVPGLPDVRHYGGDLRDAILVACPVETSTVVFRRSAIGAHRFRNDFRYAYEDLMYWFDLAGPETSIVFSPVVGTQYGEGVNIYRAAEGSTMGRLRVTVGSTMFGAGVRRAHRLTASQAAAVKARLARNRTEIASHILHRLRRRQSCLLPELRAYVRAYPAAWLLLPIEVAGRAVQWLAGRADNP